MKRFNIFPLKDLENDTSPRKTIYDVKGDNKSNITSLKKGIYQCMTISTVLMKNRKFKSPQPDNGQLFRDSYKRIEGKLY